ncbi:MAG: endonuclease [Nocardioides sp.]|nr:endonuclease [Nocardioides sp.]
MSPRDSIHEAAFWVGGGEGGLPLAGRGAPLVAEFCLAEFAAAIGRTTDSGKLLIAHGLELKYRLPRTWDRMTSGDLPAWRARRVAEATLLLSPEAAAYVDAQVAPFAHKVGFAQLDRLVQEAMDRFMPEVAKEKAEQAADSRHVRFHHDQVSFNGTTRIEGELGLVDGVAGRAPGDGGGGDRPAAARPGPSGCRRWGREGAAGGALRAPVRGRPAW